MKHVLVTIVMFILFFIVAPFLLTLALIASLFDKGGKQ